MGRAGASLNLCLGRALMFSTRTPDQTEGPPWTPWPRGKSNLPQ